jgi:hypothetical protein
VSELPVEIVLNFGQNHVGLSLPFTIRELLVNENLEVSAASRYGLPAQSDFEYSVRNFLKKYSVRSMKYSPKNNQHEIWEHSCMYDIKYNSEVALLHLHMYSLIFQSI